jgi:hypothetical protein
VGAGVLQVASAVGDGSRGFWYIPQGGALSSNNGNAYGVGGGTAGGKRLTGIFDSSSGSDSGNFVLGTPPVNGTTAGRTWFQSVINFMAGVGGGGGGSADGKLNLKNNDLVIGTATLADVKAKIVSGYNNGAWNGVGIMSDMMSGADSDKALGYAAGNDPVIAALGGILSGQTFDTSSVIVKYTYDGDANLDGKVDISDLAILSTNWQLSGKNWTGGDFNYSADGKVDISDLALLSTNWQKGVGSPLGLSFAEALDQVGLSGITVVPEPGTLGVLALGALGLMARRRRA